MKKTNTFTPLNCLVITLAYFAIGGLWALSSDNIFSLLFYQTTLQQESVIYNHWFFVSLSSLSLYGLLRYWNHSQTASTHKLSIMKRSLDSFAQSMKTISHSENDIELLQEICRICVETGGHQMAWIAIAENDAQKSLSPAAFWGGDQSFLDGFRESWDNTERGQGPSGTCVRMGEAVVFQDLKTNRRYRLWNEEAQKYEFASCAALPLKDHQKTFGALVILNAKTNAFDQDETRLLTEMSTSLSYGLSNLRLVAQRQKEQDERLMLATVTDQTSDGVITFDKEGTIQYMNSSFRRLCGISSEQGVGVSVHHFECSQRNRVFYQAILDVFASNRVKKGHFINTKRDGSQYEIEACIAPIFDRSGCVTRYVASVRDVSREVRLQKQLDQALKTESIAMLSGAVAHECTKALGRMLNRSESMLDATEASVRQQADALSVYKKALRTKVLVEEFMLISREHEEVKKNLSIHEVVSNSLKDFRPSLPTGVSLKVSMQKECGLVHANDRQIQYALRTLLKSSKGLIQCPGNVIEINVCQKTIHAGKDNVSLGVAPGDYVSLSITSSGEGFSDGEFDPFIPSNMQKGKKDLAHFAVAEIVKKHGGYLSVNSIQGIGTTFVVLLPQAGHTDKLSQRRVLCVGAESDPLASVREELIKMKLLVQAEIDGRKALSRITEKQEHYDLVIVDQEICDMSGEMFTREATSLNPDIAIILCSDSDQVVGLENEAFYQKGTILLKPYAVEDLCKTVKSILLAS